MFCFVCFQMILQLQQMGWTLTILWRLLTDTSKYFYCRPFISVYFIMFHSLLDSLAGAEFRPSWTYTQLFPSVGRPLQDMRSGFPVFANLYRTYSQDCPVCADLYRTYSQDCLVCADQCRTYIHDCLVYSDICRIFTQGCPLYAYLCGTYTQDCLDLYRIYILDYSLNADLCRSISRLSSICKPV